MWRAFRLSILLLTTASIGWAADVRILSERNYEDLVPVGKEVDAIYGDFLLENDQIVAVVAAPGENRDANLTVRNVGGSLIDLTRVEQPSDQLSCFYPGGGRYTFTKLIEWPQAFGALPSGAVAIALEGHAAPLAGQQQSTEKLQVGYQLNPGEGFLRVVSTITNTGAAPLKTHLRDGVRADGPFKFGVEESLNLAWAQEEYWRQAYGLQPEDQNASLHALKPGSSSSSSPRQIGYSLADQASDAIELSPGESVTWRRIAIVGGSTLDVNRIARKRLGKDEAPIRVLVRDAFGAVAGVRVEVHGAGEADGVGHTNEAGELSSSLPNGAYELRISAQGHKPTTATLQALANGQQAVATVILSKPAFAEAEITDAQGSPIPAKVQLIGLGDTPNPHFGPDSAVHGVANLQYTANGRFRAKLLPGRYRWIASYGPEYDAGEGEFAVAPGETVAITASLHRSVDTTGWISSELHSHSSPSGDNTASQRGRVLNLLAEHLEFCPCTEHQRIDVYDEHLTHFDAAHRMLTCPGIELTGRPLPLNHQNAFPLVHRPHHQHGGAPLIHPDPVEQIKRLASWDNNSEKFVQSNHPDIAQMVGDRDEDGEPDAGFEKMFGFMDCIEIHPPELIFEPLGAPGEPDNGVGTGGWDGRGNPIVNWMQLLNLGYRVTGVVNTDAHYNRHGSGWLRNWVRSTTDDPANASVAELVHEFEHGHVVVSNGPFLEVKAVAGGAHALPGDDLFAPQRKVTLHVKVQCPNWLEVNRVQVFVNGRPVKEHNFTARSHAKQFGEGAQVFDEPLEITLDSDAHLIVAACGEGKQLGAVYGKTFGATMPVAVSNPVFVDIDGDANGDGIQFEWNYDDLGAPLPRLKDLRPSHGHDHVNHR